MRVAFADPALRLGGLLAALLIGTATHAAGIAALPVVAPVQSCEALAQTDLTNVADKPASITSVKRVDSEIGPFCRVTGTMIVESRAAAPAAAAASIPPLGLEANRKGLKMAIGWSFEQKITPRRLSVDELFDETTAQLAA